ncbi:hypothetical protein Daus18300_009981 [Diaporthe australafricana]|uniref:AT hook domain-containing protein n=1 Tax=Diaporthe australafricana TaxID=127596 RepID=A0ABR3WBZ7_9PEZI
MAPTKTAAKGRGRAARTSEAGAAAAVESPPPAAAADETPKRRGRPAKSESGVSSAKVKKPAVPGRGRGRPPNPNTVPKAPYVSTGRPRGRPPGTGKKVKAAAIAARFTGKSGALKKGTTVARGGPKGRKSDAAKAKDADEDEELGEDVKGDDEEQSDEQLSDEDGGE